MRNLKKLLAVIVAICVLASFTVPAFAATSASFTYADQAKKLYDMKLYAGNSATSYVPDLGSKLTREAGITLLVRMLGKEKDALAMTDADTVLADYKDVKSLSSWAKKYVAYAVKTKMVEGTSTTEKVLSPVANLTGNQMATMILKNLGYTVDATTFSAAASTLSSKGGLTADEATKFASKNLIRDDAAGIMFGSLKAKDSNGKVVIDNLVAAGVVTADAAKAAGVYTSAALDVSSAVAINSKYVEVSLGTAATAADLTGVTVKDSTGKAVDVSKVEFAPWATDSKTVLVTLGTDTAAGTYYTLTVGTKSVNFGGKAKDTDKPTVSEVKSTDYNKVKITFSEAIKLDGAIVILAEKYGSKTALTASNLAYDGKDAIVVTTGDQKSNTLYGAEISGVADFAANAMDKSTDKTFIGQSKSTNKQSVQEAIAIEYNKVFVRFGVNVDVAKIAAATFKVEEAYGSKAVIATGSVTAATEDNAADAGFTTTSTVTKADAAKKGVVITLTGELKNNTLYKVTVTGFDTLYGQPMSSTDADTFKTFIGKAKPASDSLTYDGIPSATCNTKIEVKFTNKLDKATAEAIANYAIVESYGSKAALTVSKAELDGKKVTLTVSSMKNILYKITATGLKDIYGNSIKTASDSNITTFVGKAVAAKIDGIDTAAIDANDSTVLLVDFNQNVGGSYADVSHYFIDNGIGYPSKAVKGDSADLVKLTIPKTNDGKTYKITVKGLENADGVAMATDGVSKTFTGRGLTPGLPKIQAVMATDERTIKIYFDRDVTDSSIKGKLWGTTANTLNTNVWTWKTSAPNANYVAFDTAVNEYAYQDSTDKNVLVLRTSDATAPFKSGQNYNSFWLKAVDTLAGSGNNELQFNSSNDTATKVELQAAMGVNTNTITLYFNQAINKASLDAALLASKFEVKKASDGSAVALATSSTKVSDTQFKVTTSTTMSSTQYTLKVKDTSGITDITGMIGFNDALTSDTVYSQSMTISGSGDSVSKISGIYAYMTNKRTVVVYFPVDMYQNGNNADSVLQESNYTLSNSNGSFNPAYVEYSADTTKEEYKATLYLTQDFVTTGTPGTYYVTVASTIKDATQLAGAVVDSTDNKNKVQLAYNSDAVSEPVLLSSTVSDDHKSITATFDKPVVFGTAGTLGWHSGAGAIGINQFKTDASTSAATFTSGALSSYFTATGKDVNNNNLVISSITRVNNTDVAIAFAVAPALGSEVEVKVTVNADIRDMRNILVKQASADVSTIKVGIPSSVTAAYDQVAPALVSRTSYDTNGNGKVDTVKIVYDKPVQLTASTATTGFAVKNGANAIEISSASASGSTVTLALDESDPDTATTGIINVALNNTTTVNVKGTNNIAVVDMADGAAIDAAAPVLKSVSLATANDKDLTLTFSENVNNNQTNAANLKALIKIATDGSTFAALAAGDTITTVPDGTGTTLVINFAAALTTTTNKVSIDAAALKDATGNTNTAITTAAIDATNN